MGLEAAILWRKSYKSLIEPLCVDNVSGLTYIHRSYEYYILCNMVVERSVNSSAQFERIWLRSELQMLAYVTISTRQVPPKIPGLGSFSSRLQSMEWRKTVPKYIRQYEIQWVFINLDLNLKS